MLLIQRILNLKNMFILKLNVQKIKLVYFNHRLNDLIVNQASIRTSVTRRPDFGGTEPIFKPVSR